MTKSNNTTVSKFKFNRDGLKKSLEENASKQAYFAVLDEIEDILPVHKYISDVKAGTTTALTVAGHIAIEFKKGNLSERQLKDFCHVSGLNPEQTTSLWASLPKVLKPECQWYKSNNRKFSVERDAVTFMTEFLSDEELDAIATEADKANQALTEKANAEQAEIEKAKALFA